MTEPIDRVLIVGLGSIGRRHARIIRSLLPSAQLACLRHGSQADDVRGEVDRCFSRVEEALAFAPQAAVIACPSTHHLEAALPLAGAGVHLLIEKPIAAHRAGVGDLLDLCERRGAVLMTGYNLRFSRSLGRFRALLQGGAIGRILSVRSEVGQYLPSWRPGTDPRSGVTAQAALGGGVLLELSHEIDYLRWILGDVAWVSGHLLRQSSLGVDVEDVAHLTLGFADREEESAPVARLDMDFVRRDPVRSCTAIGDAGTIRWNGMTGEVETFDAAEGWSVSFHADAARDATYVDEWRDFLGAIGGGRPPAVTGRDGLAVLDVVEAARRSSASHGARVMVQRA